MNASYNKTNLPLHKTIQVLTRVSSDQEQRNARLMIASLRAFGGRFADCPVWVFTTDPDQFSAGLDELPNTQVIPLELPAQGYIFQAKVHACAQAEALARPEIHSLIWMNPQCLITKPPELFDLAHSRQAALRTAHIQNIGSPVDQPLDGYWRAIYQAVELEDSQRSLESYVDARALRPYINSHLFAIDPHIGLLQRWRQTFDQLCADNSFQSKHCADIPHKVFLHQAVLSALALKLLDWQEIRWLPPEYSYPLHFHPQVPPNLRPATLNELVCPVYEGEFNYPASLNGLAAQAPLQSWLAAADKRSS